MAAIANCCGCYSTMSCQGLADCEKIEDALMSFSGDYFDAMTAVEATKASCVTWTAFAAEAGNETKMNCCDFAIRCWMRLAGVSCSSGDNRPPALSFAIAYVSPRDWA